MIQRTNFIIIRSCLPSLTDRIGGPTMSVKGHVIGISKKKKLRQTQNEDKKNPSLTLVA